jgi:hypothetical protein
MQPQRENRLPRLLRNWLSQAGIVLGGLCFLTGVILLAVDFQTKHASPYFGLLLYLVVPMLLSGCLLLVVAGVVWTMWRERKGLAALPLLTIDLQDRTTLTRLVITAAAFLIVVAVSAVATYRAYHFTESVEFCGKTCHQVMKPEYTSFQNSPHSNTSCAECHIGPGAEWYVNAKLSGLYQVYSVLFNKYKRPIETPISNLRPARDTCLACHWPSKFFGAVLRTWTHYLPNKENSPWSVKMLLNIGGGDPAHGMIHGIHWHMEGVNTVEYIAADARRTEIPWVRVTDQKGAVTIFQTTDEKLRLAPEKVAGVTPRRMDCLDCHNRPTHRYLSPNEAVDLAMSSGEIDSSLPSVKETAAKLLAATYTNDVQAQAAIADGLSAKYPDSPKLADTIQALQRVYGRNFFPEMKVRWEAYPNHIGHKISAGCFRCHDGLHVSSTGATIRKDCTICHTILAQGASVNPEGMSQKGLTFEHPEDIGDAWQTDRCDTCHTGAP